MSYVLVPLHESFTLTPFYYKKLWQCWGVLHWMCCCFTNALLVNSADIQDFFFSVLGINYNFFSLQATVGFAAFFITWDFLEEEMQKTTDRKFLSQ